MRIHLTILICIIPTAWWYKKVPDFLFIRRSWMIRSKSNHNKSWCWRRNQRQAKSKHCCHNFLNHSSCKYAQLCGKLKSIKILPPIVIKCIVSDLHITARSNFWLISPLVLGLQKLSFGFPWPNRLGKLLLYRYSVTHAYCLQCRP